MQMLGGEGVALSPDAQQLKDWVEKGGSACHARPCARSATQPHACRPHAAMRVWASGQRAAGHGEAPGRAPAPRARGTQQPSNRPVPRPPPPGVVDAVRERFLKKLYFGIAADPDCTSILEVRRPARAGTDRAPSGRNARTSGAAARRTWLPVAARARAMPARARPHPIQPPGVRFHLFLRRRRDHDAPRRGCGQRGARQHQQPRQQGGRPGAQARERGGPAGRGWAGKIRGCLPGTPSACRFDRPRPWPTCLHNKQAGQDD